MKNGLLTIGTILALICVGQAKDKLPPTKDAAQSSGLGTIIVYRQWSLGAAAYPNWKFNVDHGPDLIVRNGTYLRVDIAPGDHVLDHNHMFLFGSDPQTVHVKAGNTVYFQYVEAASLVFEVADDQAQAAPDGQQNEIRGRSSSSFAALERFVPPPTSREAGASK